MYTNDTIVWFFQKMAGPSALEISWLQATVTPIIILLFVVSLLVNVFIVLSIYIDRRLRTNRNILIANIAVSDVLYSLLVFPSEVINNYVEDKWLVLGDLGLATCKLVPFLGSSCVAVSTYSCVLIAIERYYTVAHPFKGGFSQSRRKYIPVIWIVAMIIHSPYLYVNTLVEHADNFYCLMDWSLAGVSNPLASGKMYHTMLLILDGGVPFLLIPLTYFLILYKLRKHKLPGLSVDSARVRREQQNRNVLKIFVVIISLLFCSWLVYILFWVLTLNEDFDYWQIISFAYLDFGVSAVVRLSVTYFFILVIFVDAYVVKNSELCWKNASAVFVGLA